MRLWTGRVAPPPSEIRFLLPRLLRRPTALFALSDNSPSPAALMMQQQPSSSTPSLQPPPRCTRIRVSPALSRGVPNFSAWLEVATTVVGTGEREEQVFLLLALRRMGVCVCVPLWGRRPVLLVRIRMCDDKASTRRGAAWDESGWMPA